MTVTDTYDYAAAEYAERRGRMLSEAYRAGFEDREDLDADLDALTDWWIAHPIRPATAFSAWLLGDTLAEAFAVGELTNTRVYFEHRRRGVSHSEAYLTAKNTHTHDWAVTVDDGRCPVLGTGTITTTSTCRSCGETTTSRRTKNYSGD